MTMPAPYYTLHHLPVASELWDALLPQYILRIAARENPAYANWAGERLMRAVKKSAGVAALHDGALLGFVLFEMEDGVAEFSFPWTAEPDTALAAELVRAGVQVVHEQPEVRDIRAERQLLSDDMSTDGLEAAGFVCHQRRRMGLELTFWSSPLRIAAGYHFTRWNIHYLDAAAEVIFRANAGQLDQRLYYAFFGDAPAECRKGVLAILAGKYGQVNQSATTVALHGNRVVGVNLVINNDAEFASIIELSVAPEHQGKHLGRALMVAALRELKQQCYPRVELAVTIANTRALRLYESMGFTAYNDFPVCVWPRPAGDR